MNPRITAARAIGDFCLALEFMDGSRGVVDLAPWISGRAGVFAALQDPAFFARVGVDAQAGTVVWPNGVDLDPDMLYEAAHAASVGSDI
ncbi:MAG TPA: DUF2442 domain-containing protein [Longimicrobiaceae bacterium]|nr:DUF2442 domain-containing protein [Longimicrobiaceae bacterium]